MYNDNDNNHRSPIVCANITTTGKGTINTKSANYTRSPKNIQKLQPRQEKNFGAWHQHRHQQRPQLSFRRDGSRPCRGEVSSAVGQAMLWQCQWDTPHVSENIAHLKGLQASSYWPNASMLMLQCSYAASSLTWGHGPRATQAHLNRHKIERLLYDTPKQRFWKLMFFLRGLTFRFSVKCFFLKWGC